MRNISLILVCLLVFAVDNANSAKCRGKYYEMRGGDGFIAQRGCRGLDTQISEEYWTTIGYDGVLRDGRTTDDFLVFPKENNQELRNSFVGYWITRSKYGESRHYEAFGHVFIKPDGRVCGWFVGMENEVVEVCGGFRVLSRSRRVPHEAIPFEWVQGPQYRNRDTLGFHHHKIAKYELNADEVFYGDADINGKKFQGVSPVSETFVQVDSPDAYSRRVWLLKKKTVLPPSDDPSANFVMDIRPEQDPRVYNDPHHERRLAHMRMGPGYVETESGLGPNTVRRFEENSRTEYRPPHQRPFQSEPSYESWLLNQYRLRGVEPRRGKTEQKQNANYESEVGNDVLDSSQLEYNGNTKTSKNTQSTKNEQPNSERVSEYAEDKFQEKTSPQQEPSNVRLIRYRPRTVVRDKKGNMYEQQIENGKIYFYTIPNEKERRERIAIPDIDPKIEQVLENRRRHEDVTSFNTDTSILRNDPVDS